MAETDIGDLFEQPGMRLLAALDECVFAFDQSGRCLHANANASGLLRIEEPDHIVGRPLAEVLVRVQPFSLPSWEQCLVLMGQAGCPGMRSDYEVLTRADGVELPVAMAVMAVGVGDAQVLLVTVRDIGESMRQSKAFHASVKSFRDLLDGVSDAIFFVSRQGRVVDANQGVFKMFGHAPSVFQGKSIDNILDPASHERGLIASAAPGAIDGQSAHVEFVARDRQGRTFPAEAYLYPTSYFNQPVALVIVHDITERRRQEAALIAARDQAEQGNRLKGEIMRNMSHEFRTPLAAVIGMGDLLADGELDDEQRVYLEEIRSGAKSLLDMVNTILELARLESGHYRSDRVDFNLHELIGELVRRFEPSCRKKGLVLHGEVDSALPDMLSGDMDGIGKTLGFLLDNAVKFTASGEITLAVRLVGEEPASGGCRVRILVRDTGIGIDPAAQRTIFDAFVQGDGSATRRHGGVGLGLGIASRLVEAIGGELCVDSEPGRGSEFYFDLTLAPAEI